MAATAAASVAVSRAPAGAAPAASGWTREAYEEAMRRSGRPVSLTDAQFEAIQARKPDAMKLIDHYLTERLKAADRR